MEIMLPKQPDWEMSEEAYQEFLLLLDPDPEQAGIKYINLHEKLVRFFEAKRFNYSDVLADRVLDRAMKLIEEGKEIEKSVEVFVLGVARFYVKELYNRGKQGISTDDDESGIVLFSEDAIDAEDEKETLLKHLDKCLDELTENDRNLILKFFYKDEDGTHIPHRKELAESEGISANNLRVKVFRIKGKVEKCLKECARTEKV